MAVILGINVVLRIYDNGGWRMYACARSLTLNVQTDFIDTSVVGAGKFKSILPTINSFTGTADGVVNLNSDSMLTLPDLRQKQLSHTKILVNFERTDILGNVYTDQAYFYISNSTDTGSFDGIATFSIELQGTGALSQLFTPTTLPLSAVRRKEITSTGGATFGDASLIGKDILEVDVDGFGYSEILSSGSPVDKQVVYDITTGYFIIPTILDAGTKVYILYQDIGVPLISIDTFDSTFDSTFK